MQIATNETITSVNELIDTFNKSDSFYAFQTVDGDIDDIVCSETSLNFEEKPLKNKYWQIIKNHISVAFFFSKKAKLSNTKKNKKKGKKNKQEAKSTLSRNVVYLPEKEWFLKKFEREVGKPISGNMVPFSTLEKGIRCRKKYEKGSRVYHEYKEPSRPDDIPDIVWDGPPLKCCLCISPMENCDCKGYMVLPPRFITPKVIPTRLIVLLGYLGRIPGIKKLNIPYTIPQSHETPFAQRLQEHLEIEAAVQKQLEEMDICGPQFCVFRCHNYRMPRAHQSSRYLKLKKELYNSYKKKEPMVEVKVETPRIQPTVSGIADEFVDGLYRSVSTQATTDEDGEFVMGDVTHILFGRGDASVLQDIEGTPYCVCSYQDVVKIKSQTVIQKIENLLSISGIKKRVSKLTSNFMTSIVEINDPGIPSNTRATQDPSLDSYYESIIVPSNYKFIKNTNEEECPCCKNYKDIHAVDTERIESNVIDNYDDLIAKGMDSLLDIPLSSGLERVQGELKSFINEGLKEAEILSKVSSNKENLVTEKFQKKLRQLGFSDEDNLKMVGKQTAPSKDNPLMDKENESKVKNINDNIELIKRHLMASKLFKKYKPLDEYKDLQAIQSESKLNEEGNESEQKITNQTTGLINENDKKDIHKVRIGETKIILEEDLTKTEEKNGKNGDKVKIEPKKSYNVAFKGTGKKNNQMNSLEFLESIKPCCIDNLYKQLERKISNEIYITKLLNQIFRSVGRFIYSIEKKRLQEIKNNITNEKKSDNPLAANVNENKNLISDNIDSGFDKAEEPVQIRTKDIVGVKISKINKSLKSSMNKFSDFIKKQRSSLKKVFTKNIKEAHLRSKSRKALSLQDFKVKISKSLKKMSNRLSSFKRNNKRSSNGINQFRSSEKDTDKKDSLDDGVSKAEYSSDKTLQNVPDILDSKTSEKEVFSVQYNSTCEFYSKNTNQ